MQAFPTPQPDPPPADVIAPRWVEVIAPAAGQLAAVAEVNRIPVELLEHALDIDERPRIQVVGDATLIVLRIPCPGPPGSTLPYATLPLGIILTPDAIAMACASENPVVRRLRAYAAGDCPLEKHHLFVLHALEVMAESYISYLSEIDRAVDALEDRLQASLANREVLELLKYQKCLVHFMTALRATEFLLERIQRTGALRIPPDDQPVLEDVLVEVRQAIDVAGISGNILGEMMDAFASIISNNLNGVMKFLAAMAIVLTVPLTISSFYGMNMALPGQHAPQAFAVTVLVSMLISAGVAVLLRRRGWL
jgi:magnesium transporter